MEILALIIIAASAGAAGPTYKCKNAAGQWTEEACVGAAAPAESEYGKAERIQRGAAARRESWDQVYSSYCHQLGYQAGYSKCVSEQVEAAEWAYEIATSSAPDSREYLRLAKCVSLFRNEVTNVVDARRAKHCYISP